MAALAGFREVFVFRSLFRTILVVMLLCAPFLQRLFADDPLAAKTLIVYATNSSDSVAVKDHYIQARFSQPASANVCPITLPDPTATVLSQSDFLNSVKTPIRNCLNSAGKTKILYIVLTYIRPFRLNFNPAFGYYAMDSYLADIWDQYSTVELNLVPPATHGYYADNQNQGNLYVPYMPLDTFRSQPRSSLIYSVWRLDGATPAIAMGLIDKATQAMNNASGAACIDRNQGDMSKVQDTGFGVGDWDLHQAGVFLSQAGFPLTEDPNPDEFGTGIAPAKCPPSGDPVAFYAGWYSLNNYNGASVFNWAPGAIGFHLESLSAFDPRSGTNWSANALINGITVTGGGSWEPALDGLPRAAGIYRNLLEGANVGDAFLRNTRWLKWVIMNIGDPLYRPFPVGGKAPFNPPPALNSLAIALRENVAGKSIVGGVSTTGTVTLAAPAPTGGVTVSLTTASSLLSIPGSVAVPAGAQSANFRIGTQPVGEPATVALTATFGAVTLNNAIMLLPLLAAVGTNQDTVSGGQTITGTVLLNVSAPPDPIAPPGGVTVGLWSTDTTVATVPPTVFIPAGLARVSFQINTSSVQSNKSTTILAFYNDALTSATLVAVPAIQDFNFSPSTVPSGQFTVLAVYLNVPAPQGGATVTVTNLTPGALTLSASSIFVAAGARYGNVGATAGQGPATATVQASYGGDTKSAVLTIN